MAALQIRDFETANRFLGIMKATPGTGNPMASSLQSFIAACEALHRQDPENAAVHSKECLRQLEESGNTSYLPTTHLLVAHAYRALGEHGDAAGHLAHARRIGAEIESGLAAWLSALTEAYFHLDANDEAPAVALLREGLRIGREHGFYGTFLWRAGFF